MAYWIGANQYDYPHCSNCGAKCLIYQDYEWLSPFCPNCGEKMVQYSLIYHDKWSSLVMGKYETYGEALLAMAECRKWCHESYRCHNSVRFEILEV